MAILNNSNAISSGGYDINNSLRFRSSASAYLSRTFATTGTSRQKFTFSFWIKRGTLTTASQQRIMDCYDGSSGSSTLLNFETNDTLSFSWGNGSAAIITTTQVFRDPSAWYHIVIAVDTTQATASNRGIMYVNGSQVTAFSTATYPTQNLNCDWMYNSANNRIMAQWSGGSGYTDGYLAEVNFIDGQALTPSSFGETSTTTGSWVPKAYTGTYGTNGFYLKFADASAATAAAIGKDSSGNGNNWTPSGISVTAGTTYDAMTDSPTLTSATVANYATINPLLSTSNVVLSEANLKAQVGSTGGVYRTAGGTFAVSSGKWYWELVFGNPTAGNPLAGVGDITVASSSWNADTSTNANFWYVDGSNGNKINGTGGPGSSYGSSFTTSDTCMVALDMDNGKIWWGKNGTWFASGDPAAGTNAAYTNLASKLLTIALMGGCGSCGFSGNLYQLNFGQRPFAYTPPTGFVRLNTFNLPNSTIVKGNTVMDSTLWTGNGSTSFTATNAAGFKPDLVWAKKRSGATNNQLYDSVRGAGNNKELESNTTSSEGASNADVYGYLSAFNSNGFSAAGGTDPSFPIDYFNASGATYVGWQWQAGKGSTSSNTSGSITSTVSVNATAGFSIVTYTGNATNGATVGHGLGVAPRMIIGKIRSTTGDWYVWQTAMGDNFMRLNTTAAQVASTANGVYNTASFSSTVFALGSGSSMNASGATFVAYCWAEIAGFSKFGSYTGNGSTDGPFVYTGFRPEFIMYKRTDATQSWILMDTSRSPYNVADKFLLANNSDSEYTGTILDMLSNGFKVREAGTQTNASGGTYIFMAFAENPFKNSNAR